LIFVRGENKADIVRTTSQVVEKVQVNFRSGNRSLILNKFPKFRSFLYYTFSVINLFLIIGNLKKLGREQPISSSVTKACESRVSGLHFNVNNVLQPTIRWRTVRLCWLASLHRDIYYHQCKKVSFIGQHLFVPDLLHLPIIPTYCHPSLNYWNRDLSKYRLCRSRSG